MKQVYNEKLGVWMLLNDAGRIVDYKEKKFEYVDVVENIQEREVKK